MQRQLAEAIANIRNLRSKGIKAQRNTELRHLDTRIGLS
jgi:hypothetical protein